MPTAELLNASNGLGAWAFALTGADRNATVQSTIAARVSGVGEAGLISAWFVVTAGSLSRFVARVNNANDYRRQLCGTSHYQCDTSLLCTDRYSRTGRSIDDGDARRVT